MSTLEEPDGSARSEEPSRVTRWFLALVTNQQFILLLVLVVLMGYLQYRNSLFFTVSEFNNLIIDFSALVLLVVAETYVITSGGIDLSVGTTGAVAGVVGAYAMQPFVNHGDNTFVVLMLGVAVCGGVGLLVGLANALLITQFNLVPFVATLATYGIGLGTALVLSKGADIGYFPGAVAWSATGWWIFAWISVIVLLITLLLAVGLHVSRYGRYNFAIGSNPFAARAAGINVKRHVASVYVLSGLLSGLVGLFFFIRSGNGAPTVGQTSNLTAIAAVVIGGASLTGGRGRITGSLLGAAILTVVGDGLVFINIQPTWDPIVVGAFIMVAAILQSRASMSGAST